MGDQDFRRPAVRRPVDRVRIVVYCGLAAAAATLAAAGLGLIDVGSSGEPTPVMLVNLRGRTDEHRAITLVLNEAGAIEALHTSIVGLCENDRTYTVDWDPSNGPVAFRSTGGGITAQESQTETVDGVLRHITVWTTLALEHRAASGDLRYRAAFTHPDGTRLRCDSGFVHWAVNRSGTASGAETGPPGAWGLVASLARNASPAQLNFAQNVDASCSSTFREGEERQLRRSAAGVSASEQDKRDVQDHQLQYDAILGLGNPPAAVGLYRSWLSNMHRRIVIEKEALSDMLAGHRRQGTRLLAEMDYLKVEGDSLGQQFGLRICTSNGPLRSTVPDRAAQQSL